MSETNSEFMDKIKALQDGYKAQLPEKLNQICLIEEELFAQVQTFDKWDDLYQLIHKLSGSSAIFGLPHISEKACKLEMFLKSILKKETLIDEEQLVLIKDLLSQLKEALSIE